MPAEPTRASLMSDLRLLVKAIPEEVQNDDTYYASDRLYQFIEHHADEEA
jgi:hypothetical protein